MGNNNAYRWVWHVCLVGLMTLLAVGCAAPAPGGAGTGVDEDSVVVRAMTSEPALIDPQGAASSGLSLVLPYLFDTLVVNDVDGKIHPLLVDSWQVSEDGRAITFELKEGVTFHDGTPLNAEAVRFTFERFKESGTRSPIYGGISQIATIKTVDDLTVRFEFEEPAANFWSTISMPYASIISPESARRVDESGEGYLMGSGPFVLDEWQVGESITLKRNPEYAWGPPIVENQAAPYVGVLEYKVIPDPSTQVAALKAGEVDIVFVNEPGHRQSLEENPSIQIQEVLLNSLIYLGFNCQKSPFDEVLVRQALAHAVDKEEIVEVALGGLGQESYAFLPPMLPGFVPELEEYELGYNPQMAQALLVQAGFKPVSGGGWVRDGVALEGKLLTSTRAPNEMVATLLQSQLKDIGVPVEIQQLDAKAVMQATSDGQFDLLLWRYDWNDPDALNIFLSTERIGSTNRVAYSNPEVDVLLEAGAHELDEDARRDLYVAAQVILLQDAPWQPLYTPLDVIAMSERVSGARVGFMGRLLLNDVRVTEP